MGNFPEAYFDVKVQERTFLASEELLLAKNNFLLKESILLENEDIDFRRTFKFLSDTDAETKTTLYVETLEAWHHLQRLFKSTYQLPITFTHVYYDGEPGETFEYGNNFIVPFDSVYQPTDEAKALLKMNELELGAYIEG